MSIEDLATFHADAFYAIGDAVSEGAVGEGMDIEWLIDLCEEHDLSLPDGGRIAVSVFSG